ncbi:MAG: ribonuclease HII [Oscillospiraceae bacterium]
MNLWEIEREYAEKGYRLICGADEAGAGPLAGAVYAAAVILPLGLEIEGLNDSKQVSEKKREALFDIIQEKAVAWAINSVDAGEIDETNILVARLKAMDLCIEMLEPKPDFALIDGNRDKGIRCSHLAVVKGDSRSANIAAASILAKVSRDRYMVDMDKIYPEYGFAKHKGYPTKAHYEALRKYGPCPIHRRTFLKNL